MKLWYRMIRRLEEIYIRKHKEEFLLRKQKWDEEFYECIQDIAKHPVVLRMNYIRIMEIRIVISIAFMYLTTIMCGAAFFIWMQNQRQEAGCCMICFCMTGIPMQKRRGSVSTG